MCRTPIREEFRHRPATPTTVARTTTAQGPTRNVALGLVPSRGGAARGNDARTLLPTSTRNFHTLACRRQPAWAIGRRKGGTRQTAGVVIPAIESMPRTPIRGRNPEGGWMQWHSNNPQPSHSVFIPCCAGTSRHERQVRKHVPESKG